MTRIKNSFRWSELSLPGYKSGTWDVGSLATAIEPVLLHGVSGCYVTASTD